jgi:hypothetical protein
MMLVTSVHSLFQDVNRADPDMFVQGWAALGTRQTTVSSLLSTMLTCFFVSQIVYLRAQPDSNEGELDQGGSEHHTAAIAAETALAGSSKDTLTESQAVAGAAKVKAGTCKHTH